MLSSDTKSFGYAKSKGSADFEVYNRSAYSTKPAMSNEKKEYKSMEYVGSICRGPRSCFQVPRLVSARRFDNIKLSPDVTTPEENIVKEEYQYLKEPLPPWPSHLDVKMRSPVLRMKTGAPPLPDSFDGASSQADLFPRHAEERDFILDDSDLPYLPMKVNSQTQCGPPSLLPRKRRCPLAT